MITLVLVVLVLTWVVSVPLAYRRWGKKGLLAIPLGAVPILALWALLVALAGL